MCEFISGLAFKNGDIFMLPGVTNSHEVLIDYKGLKDENQFIRNWVRFEYTPPTDLTLMADLDNWSFRIDECMQQGWIDEDSTIKKLKAKVSTMLITGDTHPILLGGCYVLLGGANVKHAINSSIPYMVENARVGLAEDCHIGRMYNKASVNYLLFGEVLLMSDQTRINTVKCYSTIYELTDDSNIKHLNNSTVGFIRKNASIALAYGTSTIESTKFAETDAVRELQDEARVIHTL